MRKVLLIVCFYFGLPALAAEDDNFFVKQIRPKQAVVEGKTKGLKAGDYLYFPKSPFRFSIESVQENEVLLVLPENADLKAGNILLRAPSEAIQKGLNTEKRLKQALED